ncbi:hypothetical protein [Lysinibacillus xylanilyticus]|uniref:hypothetical protein n=1 Tax=Lysinibacillus xylanilyticus TaxID=582475 RepID=UPI0036D78A6C
MGRVAGVLEGKMNVYGRGILKNGCPDFLKKEMSTNSLKYLEVPTVLGEPIIRVADISSLSIRSQHYLRLMEICTEDNFVSIRQDARALSDLVKEMCEVYKEKVLGSAYYIILGKALNLEALGTLLVTEDHMRKVRDKELRSQIETLRAFVTGMLVSLPDVYSSKEVAATM